MSVNGASVPDLDRLTDECVRTLSRLIRFNTANPPGNETECARWIADQLGGAGIRCHVFEPQPGRGSVIGRLPALAPGGARRKPLLLMSHIDVVPADPSEWTHDPFSGVVADGHVWGRGALDMKNAVAVWMTLLSALARARVPTDRDVIFMAAADEEAGGYLGAGWLAEHQWPLLDSEAALNEGGGHGVRVNGRLYYSLQTAEKAGCRFRVVARGTPGHGSIPLEDNAVVHLAAAVAALGRARLPIKLTDTVRAFLAAMADDQPEEAGAALRSALEPGRTEGEIEAALDRAIADPHLRAELSALMRNTLSPTMLAGSGKVNVIPARAEAIIDCRILPGENEATVRRQAEAVLARTGLLDKVELEIVPRSVPPESPAEGPLVDAIQAAMRRHSPNARVVPYMLTGATDARYLRPRGVPVYGFVPVLPEDDLRRVHAFDERISIASLRFALQVMWDVLVDFCAPRA